MKRPPGLWILLSAGVLWLSLQDVYGIRATALIFGKSTTSTTTEVPSNVTAEDRVDKETVTNTENPEASSNTTASVNSTGPILTGIPQIDYIWDPNLPQELKGYNLSEYPFYERVPETINKEIDFKCDGLHDGFYASIPHKCQVYHQCLYGTRYDFLCANYTAFDQKTFICHFVSEVDCVNSKNFWHRNDALYQTTSTAAPLKVNIYTTAPPDVGEPITPRRPAGGGARRPYRRRRPQVEYYDDEYYEDEYYDERPRATRGRKKPRPRPRPAVYDDEEEEYEDERYESRRGGGRRGPSRKRNRPRKRPEYDDDDEQVDDKFEDEDFIAGNKRQKNEEKRKPPVEDDVEERDQKRTNGKRRYPNENREEDAESDRKPPRKSLSNKRPVNDDYDDELPQSDDSRNYEQRPRKNLKGNKEENSEGRPIIKPTTGTIYDRPRVAPRINLPVPKHAADKYAFKPAGNARTTGTTKATPVVEEEEYLDEEYEEPLPKRQRNRDRRPASENKREKSKTEDSREQPSESRPRTRKPEVEEIVEKTTSRPKYGSGRNRFSRPTLPPPKKKPASEEYYDDEEYLDKEQEVQDRRPSPRLERKSTSTTTTTTTSTTTTTTTTPAPKKEKHEPMMRIIKRPFLPSRGGSPYSPRGLQPVGLKAVDKESEEKDSKEYRDEEESNVNKQEADDDYEDSQRNEKVKETPIREQQEVQTERKPYFKPSPVLMKVPIRQKYTPPSAEAQELIDSEPSYQQTYKTRDFSNPRTTTKPKEVEKNPLDLNEYDVTLNDALNPTLPNLPVRSFPTGFSSDSDFNYNTYSRPRYVLEPIITPTNQNYVNQNKVVRSHQRYERVPQSQYSTINGGYRQPGQTQAIYSSY